jgi:hypothetical protein
MIKKNLRDLYDYYFFWDGDQDLAMSPLDNATMYFTHPENRCNNKKKRLNKCC